MKMIKLFSRDKKPPLFPESFTSPKVKGFFYCYDLRSGLVKISLPLTNYVVEITWSKKSLWGILIDSEKDELSYRGSYASCSSEGKKLIDFMCDLTEHEYQQMQVRNRLEGVRKEITIFREILPEVEKILVETKYPKLKGEEE